MTDEMRGLIRKEEEKDLQDRKDSSIWATAALAAANAGVLNSHSIVCGYREYLNLRASNKIVAGPEGLAIKKTTGRRVWIYDPETGEGAEVLAWT